MIDGTRTRDIQDHNLALYQLSYDHRRDVRAHSRKRQRHGFLPQDWKVSTKGWATWSQAFYLDSNPNGT